MFRNVLKRTPPEMPKFGGLLRELKLLINALTDVKLNLVGVEHTASTERW